MQFKTEKEPHYRVTDKATLDKVHAMRLTMGEDIDAMARAIMHGVVGRGTCTLTIEDGKVPMAQYAELEVCPATMRAWLEHANSYAAAVQDMCTLLGVTEKTV
jgi:acetylglutamate kinase